MRNTIVSGAPVVCLSQTPLTISGKSLSLRGVLPFAPAAATVEIREEILARKRHARRHAVEHHADQRTVRLPKIESLNFVPYEFIAN